jgi:hypothetical protein
MNQISIVRDTEELRDVWCLNYKRYLEMGYCKPNHAGVLITHPQLDSDPLTQVCVIRDEKNKLLGTYSITLDGPAGLSTDNTYPDETNIMRRKGTLASTWRLVTEKNVCKCVLRELLDYIVGILRLHNVDFCLSTVNPHHLYFYIKFFDVFKLAERCSENNLNMAPSVLAYCTRKGLDIWDKKKGKLCCASHR